MSKDLEYNAAHNFMFNGHYPLPPGVKRPDFLHVYTHIDAGWAALADQGSRLVESPEAVNALANTVIRNLVDVKEQIKTRHEIVKQINSINQSVDPQG